MTVFLVKKFIFQTDNHFFGLALIVSVQKNARNTGNNFILNTSLFNNFEFTFLFEPKHILDFFLFLGRQRLTELILKSVNLISLVHQILFN